MGWVGGSGRGRGRSAGVPLAGIIVVVRISVIAERIRQRVYDAGFTFPFRLALAAQLFSKDGPAMQPDSQFINAGIVGDESPPVMPDAKATEDAVATMATITFEEYHGLGLRLQCGLNRTAWYRCLVGFFKVI